MHDEHKIRGAIERFLFQDIESGYMVAVLAQADAQAVTVTGTFPPLHVGQEVEFSGNWVLDPKYGQQFAASFCRTAVPNSLLGLKKFLGSGLIKGIGAVYAEKLVNKFGLEVLEIIDKRPERLSEIVGIGPKRIVQITTAWKEHQEIADVMVFLQDKGVSPALAGRIYKRYRHSTLAVVQQNPYRLAEEVWGIGFKTADELAQKLGFLPHSQERITAGVLFALVEAMQQGHLYLEVGALKKKTVELLELADQESILLTVKYALHALYEQGKIQLVSQEAHFIGLTKSHRAEKDVARCIRTLIQQPSRLSILPEAIYRDLHAAQDIQLTDDQMRGIMHALTHKVTVITGGPGTGKTTLIKKLLSLLEKEGLRYKLAAPTGRAAKRMTESTGRLAFTIHRLLEFDPQLMSFKHGEQNALPLDFLVVDESSMIDIFLAAALLKAVPHQAHVVFIGDSDQLPSVGAGNFLHDMIASAVLPCMRLGRVFRQAQDSMIIVNAHRINRGEFPLPPLPGTRKDFIFIKQERIEDVPTLLKRILFSTLQQHRIPLDQAMVLTPMNRGGAGTQALNHHMQSFLNPEVKDRVVFAGTTFKVDDRVMQIRNNYDKYVFNGDIGTIRVIDTEERVLTVFFGDQEVVYDFSELQELVLAYAITIHKSQGSEYPAVIIPLFSQHFTLLQRNLLYTAITRAKSLCILIGQPKAIGMALHNKKSVQRITFLPYFLQDTV